MKNNEQVDQELNKKSDEQILDETPPIEAETRAAEESQESRLQTEVAELKEKYLRLYSDFENFRKRTSKEKIELINTASEDVLRDLIPVVDDFERAFKAAESETDIVQMKEGNYLIFQKLLRILEAKGLKAMDDLIGNPFDADTQEAITQIPAPSEKLRGKVIDVVEKGYTLGDKVVRYAKVITGA